MDTPLTPVEARIIGSLMEKQRTTPEYYPMSVNALTNACNQKTSRDPVMTLEDEEVERTVMKLLRRQLVWQKKSSDARVLKYAHRIETIAEFSEKEQAVICVLLLRGAQTVGEIRGRTKRMAAFDSLPDVETTLQALAEHEKGPFVAKLPREAGRKERRYTHLLCGEAAVEESMDDVSPPTKELPPSDERLDRLEEEVKRLRAEVKRLSDLLNESGSDLNN